jgi:hypothetical protein
MDTKKNYLHIKQLREKFKNHKKISVKDFNDFYTEVFGKINKNTVSWYIYELKDEKIIRNISRGQYVLENMEREITNEFIVITMDIIKSTEFVYTEFNESLHKKINLINNTLKSVYKCNREFYISQGDELQVLLPMDENIGNFLMLTISILQPFKVRYGISVGEVEEKVKKNSWEMNGPIFWNARDQLEKLKDETNYAGLIISGYSQTDYLCNNILPLVNQMICKITDKQWEALKYKLSKEDVNQAIDNIKITKSSYYERIKGSNVLEILQALKAIYLLMTQRVVIQ